MRKASINTGKSLQGKKQADCYDRVFFTEESIVTECIGDKLGCSNSDISTDTQFSQDEIKEGISKSNLRKVLV